MNQFRVSHRWESDDGAGWWQPLFDSPKGSLEYHRRIPDCPPVPEKRNRLVWGVVDGTPRNRLERSHCTSNHTTQAKAKWQLARGNLPHFVAGFSSFSYLMYQWQSCCDVRTNPFPLPDDVPYLVWIGVFWVLVRDVREWKCLWHFTMTFFGEVVRGPGRRTRQIWMIRRRTRYAEHWRGSKKSDSSSHSTH